MKATSIIMTIASLALAGIFPLAGFFSKDKILKLHLMQMQWFYGQFYG